MRVHALRLAPGADLRGEIERWARALAPAAACVVTAVGSLSVARLRMPGPAGAPEQIREVAGPVEILALSGTISPDGAHLHDAVSGADGIARGGHLMAGSVIHTTAELVIAELSGLAFHRRLDALTGYAELVVTPADPT